MSGNKITIAEIVLLIASIFIVFSLHACGTQLKQSQPVVSSLTQVSPTKFMPPPTPTLSQLSDTELKNLFGDATCSWPCWEGITPGVTSDNEALENLKDSPLVLNNSIHAEELTAGFGNTKWYWKISDKQPLKGNLEWRNGIVLFNALTLYPIVSLGEIINRFGPPEKVEVNNCSPIVEGPQKWCVTLYYAKNGFEIHFNPDGSGFGDDIQIAPSDFINFVTLFKPSTIEEWLLSMSFDPHPDLRDWKGYGNLLDLYYYR